jgi:hypothetical protein
MANEKKMLFTTKLPFQVSFVNAKGERVDSMVEMPVILTIDADRLEHAARNNVGTTLLRGDSNEWVSLGVRVTPYPVHWAETQEPFKGELGDEKTDK